MSAMNNFGSRVDGIRGQRRAERASVLLPAAVVTLSAYQFPELLNISRTGAKLRGQPLPPKGTVALFKTDGIQALCRVMWVDHELCGVRFDEPLSDKIFHRLQRDGATGAATLTPDEQLVKDCWTEGKAD